MAKQNTQYLFLIIPIFNRKYLINNNQNKTGCNLVLVQEYYKWDILWAKACIYLYPSINIDINCYIKVNILWCLLFQNIFMVQRGVKNSPTLSNTCSIEPTLCCSEVWSIHTSQSHSSLSSLNWTYIMLQRGVEYSHLTVKLLPIQAQLNLLYFAARWGEFTPYSHTPCQSSLNWTYFIL